jgi:hypothetical protein
VVHETTGGPKLCISRDLNLFTGHKDAVLVLYMQEGRRLLSFVNVYGVSLVLLTRDHQGVINQFTINIDPLPVVQAVHNKPRFGPEICARLVDMREGILYSHGLWGFRSFRQASIREDKLAVFSVSLVEKEKTNVPRESFLLVPAGYNFNFKGDQPSARSDL